MDKRRGAFGESKSADSDPLIGQTFSHYQIVSRISRGGMGVVYKARDLHLDRTVAVKILPPHLHISDEARARFFREARTSSALDHPNICTVFDVDQTDDGRIFEVMACYDGETLGSKIERGPLPINEAVEIAAQMADGLAEAHKHGIVHRDVKPSNIIVTPSGLVKIIDFGIAKVASDASLTQSGATLGTPAYMSPEQANGLAVDGRTDIWSLGVVLYEMLAGCRPFVSEYRDALIYTIITAEPQPVSELRPDVPPALGRLVAALLDKQPENRPPMEDIQEELRTIRQSNQARPIEARRSRRAIWFASSSVVAVAVAAALFFVTGSTPQIHTIAVLPLEDRSADPTEEYFAAGVTTGLVSELGRFPQLRVTAGSSANRFRGSEKNLAEIARELNVESVVRGSVASDSDRVKITIEVVHLAEGRTGWTGQYDRPMTEILILQEEVARSIATEAGVRRPHARPARQLVLPEAHDTYLRGAHKWDIDLLKASIARDSMFSPAYSQLAGIYFFNGLFGGLPPHEAFPASKQAATTALSLDPQNAEAHGYLALATMHYDLDWATADHHFQRALEINASAEGIRHLYAHFLLAMGRTVESVEQSRLSLQLNPLDPVLIACLGWHSLFDGRVEDAADYARKSLQINPENFWATMILGWAHEQQGRHDEALQLFDSTGNGVASITARAHVLARSGRQDEAARMLDELLARSRERYVSAYHIAVVYAGMDDVEQALDWLEKAYEERSGDLPYVYRDYRFQRLHAVPRFQALLYKMHFGEASPAA